MRYLFHVFKVLNVGVLAAVLAGTTVSSLVGCQKAPDSQESSSQSAARDKSSASSKMKPGKPKVAQRNQNKPAQKVADTKPAERDGRRVPPKAKTPDPTDPLQAIKEACDIIAKK